jgi:hypothetical protein
MKMAATAAERNGLDKPGKCHRMKEDQSRSQPEEEEFLLRLIFLAYWMTLVVQSRGYV